MKNNKVLTRLLLNKIGLTEDQMKDYTCIYTDAQFEKLVSKGIMKKPQINVVAINIDYDKFNKRYVGTVQVAGMSTSRTIRYNCEDNVSVRNDIVIDNKRSVRVKTVDRFSNEYITVKLSDEAATRTAKRVFENSIVVVRDVEKGLVKVFIKEEIFTGETMFVDIEGMKSYASLPSGNQYVINEYKLDPATASSNRNKSGIFENVTAIDQRFENFNNATLNGLDIARKEILDLLDKAETKKDVENIRKKAQKLLGYIGNASTGSVNLGVIKGYYRFEGKWQQDTSETFLRDEYIETTEKLVSALASKDDVGAQECLTELQSILKKAERHEKQSTQDGQMYVDGVEFAALIFETLGIIILPHVLIGRMLQLRPGTIKASAVIVSPYVFQAIVRGSKMLAENAKILVTPHGDTERALFIADKNCIKFEYDITQELTMELLAFNKCSVSNASKQVDKNIVYAAKKLGRLREALALLQEAQTITLDTQISEAVSMDRPARSITPDEVLTAMQTGFITNAMDATGPSFITQSKAFVDSKWKQTVSAAVDCIDRMKASLKLESRRLVSDPTFILTGGMISGILQLGQGFINSKKITKNIMFKYPIAGLEEQYPNMNVSIKEIKSIVVKLYKAGKIEEWMKDAIIEFYSSLKSSVMVLPALMFLAMACAGLDFDYDGCVILIYTENPSTRLEEITNIFVDMLYENGIRGVGIKIEE